MDSTRFLWLDRIDCVALMVAVLSFSSHVGMVVADRPRCCSVTALRSMWMGVMCGLWIFRCFDSLVATAGLAGLVVLFITGRDGG